VSPNEIQAQLPRDLAPGDYELRVIRLGQPEVTGKFTISRTAPGLFTKVFDSQPFAMALHEDGSEVTPANPAARGERVTLLGSGFGPYHFQHPEGFALPAVPPFPIASEAKVDVNGVLLDALWAGGVAGRVGIDGVRFQVPEELSEGASVQLSIKAVVGGAPSNTVVLPIAR
jgi:uncharacterized protein (TIGR03437 family)